MFATSASFTTAAAVDTIAPVVVAVSPPGVTTPINAAIQVWFSEPMRPVDLGALSLRSGANSLPLLAAELSTNNRLLTITPSRLLKRNASYCP